MKSLRDVRKLEENYVGQDPPTILALRRKAIRLFPNNQRVAIYVNDNLHLEVAIPYTPNELGKQKISTVVNEESLPVFDMYAQFDEEFQPGDKVHVHRLYGLKLTKPVSGTVHRKIGNGLYHIKTHETAVATTHDIEEPAGKHNTHETNMTIREEIKGWKNAANDIAKARREAGNDAASVKLVTLKKDGSESGMHDATSHHKDEAEARATHDRIVGLNPNRKIKHNLYVGGKHVATLGEETEMVMEATIHSLHSITRAKTPATVRFRNGAQAMVHHGTAALVMKLHSMMKKSNKRRIENLVNASADGLKQVVDFATTHMK